MLKIYSGLLITFAYLLSGKFGLWLTVDNGYSSALFPPAGIAMAALLIYGRSMLVWVFLGALALNLLLPAPLHEGLSVWAVAALGIAVFSSLQAWAGSVLIRRLMASPLVFESGAETMRFIIAALSACLISATLSILLLYSLALLARADVVFSWLTWWVGDSLGVILMLPVTLLLIGEPKALWRARRRLLGVVIGCGMLLIVIIVKQVNSWEREEAMTAFRLNAGQIGEQIKMKFYEQESIVDQLAVFMSGSNKITHVEFERMANIALKRFNYSLQAIEWAAQVSDRERATFESLQQTIFPGFTITERRDDQRLYPSSVRNRYLPVTYLLPVAGNEAALGFDLSSNAQRLHAIELAKKLATPVATAPLKLVQEKGTQSGLLLIHWVEPGANGAGLVLVVLRIEDFMNDILKGTQNKLLVRLTDIAADKILFDNGYHSGAHATELTLELGTRSYRLQTMPTEDYMAMHRNWQSWNLLVGTLAFMSMLNLFLLLATARTARIERLVKERTEELETARNNTEKVNHLLTEHSEQLLAIFNLSPDGFVTFDEAHYVKYISPAFERLTGLTEDEIIGIHENAFFARMDNLCLPEAPFSDIALLCAAEKDATADKVQKKIQLSGAGKRVLEVSMRQSGSITVSQILYLRDITHETEVDRMKGEFLATAAHELRTPMASIYGFSEILLMLELKPGEQREYLQTIFKQAELMAAIINELLDLARIEARRGTDFILSRFEPALLLLEIITQFKTPYGRAAPELSVGREIISIRADRSKLTQTITNVLSNAYKYSPEGGVVRIELLTEQRTSGQNFVGIRISDPGIGMTPLQLSRIFERFYRADPSGQTPGTGLGMSIVQEIMKLHGGDVDIQSQPGAGTTVTLWIPSEIN